MLTISNNNQANLNFEKRFRVGGKKTVFNKPALLSWSGLLSTGFLSGYKYALYGVEAFKPSAVKEKVISTEKSISSGVSTFSQKVKNGYHKVVDFFSSDKEAKEE